MTSDLPKIILPSIEHRDGMGIIAMSLALVTLADNLKLDGLVAEERAVKVLQLVQLPEGVHLDIEAGMGTVRISRTQPLDAPRFGTKTDSFYIPAWERGYDGNPIPRVMQCVVLEAIDAMYSLMETNGKDNQ